MTPFELNIGLHVRREDAVDALYANTWEEVRGRESSLRRALSQQAPVRCHFHAGEEPTLVVAGYLKHDLTEEFLDWIEKLARVFGQDCIAVYFPYLKEGRLVGPNAKAWGDFQLALFERFRD